MDQHPFDASPLQPDRQSLRWRDFDYSSEGAYFVTIVTTGRRCLFGQAVQGVLQLSEAGRMIEETLDQIAVHQPGVTVPVRVVMPNHVHFILDIISRAATGNAHLSHVVGAWKSLTTQAYWSGVRRGVHLPIQGSLWQRGYYDHVVRDPEDYRRIRWYIQSNPARWCVDRENPWPGLM